MTYRFRLGSTNNSFIFYQFPINGQKVTVEIPKQDLTGKVTAGLINNNQKVDFLIDGEFDMIARGTIDLTVPVQDKTYSWVFDIFFDGVEPKLFDAQEVTMVCDMGSAFGVGIQGNTLEGLNDTDVNDTNPLNDNDVLFYDSALQKWTHGPAPPAVPVAHNIISAEHGDTQLTGALTNNDVLTYDTVLSKWTNKQVVSGNSNYFGVRMTWKNAIPMADGDFFFAANIIYVSKKILNESFNNADILQFEIGQIVHLQADNALGFPHSQYEITSAPTDQGTYWQYTAVQTVGLGSFAVDQEILLFTLKKEIIPTIDTSAGHKTIHRISDPNNEGEWQFTGNTFRLNKLFEGGVDSGNIGFNANTHVIFYSKTSEKYWYLIFPENFTIVGSGNYWQYASITASPVTNPFVDGEETYMIVVRSQITNINLIPNVTITAPSINQVLTWDGSAWVNQALPAGVSTLNDLTDTTISGSGDPNVDHKHLKWDNSTERWVDGYISVPDDQADTNGHVWKDSADQKLMYKPTGDSEKIVSYQYVKTYASINADYSPNVRWIPEGITGSSGSFVWNSSVGSGTLTRQGGSLTISPVGGKNALWSNPSVYTDPNYLIELGLGTTFNFSSGFTYALVVEDLIFNDINASLAEGRVFELTATSNSSGAGNLELYALGKFSPPSNNHFVSVFSNTQTEWTGINVSTVEGYTQPFVIICRYNPTGTEYKIWINSATDQILGTTNTYNMNSATSSFINIAHRGGSNNACSKLKVAEVICWNSVLTDQNVTDLSTALLTEYGVRTTGITIGDANILLNQISDVTLTNPATNQVLTYSAGGEWINQALPIEPQTSGYVYSYDGTDTTTALGGTSLWRLNGAGTEIRISNLTDGSPSVDIVPLLIPPFSMFFYHRSTNGFKTAFFLADKNVSVVTGASDTVISGLVGSGAGGFTVSDECKLIINISNVSELSQLIGVNLSGLANGDNLVYIGTSWVNRIPTSGQIKVNSFNTNLSSNVKPTFINLTTEQEVVYRLAGETFTSLNASSFPTTSVPLTQNAGVYSDELFYDHGVTQADDRFKQQPIQGVIVEYRIELSYTNKTASNSGRIQLRIYNPDSGFSLENNMPLAQGITADAGYLEFITISDSANVGAGLGYKMGVSSTTSLDLVIDSITCISREYAYRA